MRLSFLLCLTAVALFPSFAEAKYNPLKLTDLLGASDLILVGEITRVLDRSFELTISERLAGTYSEDKITIVRFRDWPCARRWAPYKVGQRVLVCLAIKKRRSEADGKEVEVYRVRSGGNEGEMPIVGDHAYYLGSDVKLKTESLEAFGHSLRAKKLTLSQVRSLVKKYRGKTKDEEAGSR